MADEAAAAAAAENPPPQIEEQQKPPSPIQPDPTEEEATATIQPQIGDEKNDAEETRPEPEEKTAPIEIASETEEEDKNEAPSGRIRLEFPTGRVKRIMKLDSDINKINSEALHLVTLSAQLFLEFLAEASGQAAKEKKRKVVKLEHIRTAAKRHRATRDFLVDELPVPVAAQPSDQKSDIKRSRGNAVVENSGLAGTRRIDDFFSKSVTKSPVHVEES